MSNISSLPTHNPIDFSDPSVQRYGYLTDDSNLEYNYIKQNTPNPLQVVKLLGEDFCNAVANDPDARKALTGLVKKALNAAHNSKDTKKAHEGLVLAGIYCGLTSQLGETRSVLRAIKTRRDHNLPIAF